MPPTLPTIRAITLAIGDPHPLDHSTITRAATFLRAAQSAAEAAGYTVQTTRIATRPLLADLPDADASTIARYTDHLQSTLDATGLAFLSLGPAPTDDPTFPLDRIPLLLPALLHHPALNATVQVASHTHGLRHPALLPTAQLIAALAAHDDGFPNFRFAALACCDPDGPFFPQAYTLAPGWRVSIGLQSAALLRDAITAHVAHSGPGHAALPALTTVAATAIAAAAHPIVHHIRAQATAAGHTFTGLDLSPAPMGDESIVDAIEAVGLGDFGAPGTLSVVAALTAALKTLVADPTLPTCGYNGLMLPVLEDQPLGQRCATGSVSIADLLTYSTICGTGLDTVPIPGDTPPQRVAALLSDIATLALRLHKPLSARLFLVPDGHPGDLTHFTSPYITNTRILPL